MGPWSLFLVASGGVCLAAGLPHLMVGLRRLDRREHLFFGLGVLTVAAYGLDYVAGALGVKRFGGSRWAIAGAVIGALVGLFFGLPGLLLGPLVGALGAEYMFTRQLGPSARAALGTVVGLLVGAVAKIGLGLAMVALFVYWVWRG